MEAGELEKLLARIEEELARSALPEPDGWYEMPDPTADGLGRQERSIPVYEGGVPFEGRIVPWMDERYMFCGQVTYRSKLGRDPLVYCDDSVGRAPARCGLACPSRLCAFVDPAFDWEKAQKRHENCTVIPDDWPKFYEDLEEWRALKRRRAEDRGEELDRWD